MVQLKKIFKKKYRGLRRETMVQSSHGIVCNCVKE